MTVIYLSCRLSRESVHKFLHPKVRENGGVEKKLRVLDFFPINEKAVRHQWVPVVEYAELQSDAVAVLVTCIEEHFGIELKLQQVTTQLLHILFYYNADCLS